MSETTLNGNLRECFPDSYRLMGIWNTAKKTDVLSGNKATIQIDLDDTAVEVCSDLYQTDEKGYVSRLDPTKFYYDSKGILIDKATGKPADREKEKIGSAGIPNRPSVKQFLKAEFDPKIIPSLRMAGLHANAAKNYSIAPGWMEQSLKGKTVSVEISQEVIDYVREQDQTWIKKYASKVVAPMPPPTSAGTAKILAPK